MVNIRRIIIGLLVVIIGIFVARYILQSEKRKVKKRFDLLSEWVSKDLDESSFTMARKALSIGTLFADNCILKTHVDSVSGTYNPKEISSLAARVRSDFSNLSLRFRDLDIGFPEPDKARVILTAQLSGGSKTRDHVDDIFELESDLKKLEDKWLFTAFEVVEVLEE